MTQLAVVADRRLLGVVTRSPDSDLSFAYDPDWLRNPDAFWLSLSLPLRPDPFRSRARPQLDVETVGIRAGSAASWLLGVKTAPGKEVSE